MIAIPRPAQQLEQHVTQAIHRTGFGKIPTLKAVGTELLKKRRLLFSLDSLSRYGFTESMGDINDTFDKDQVFSTRW
jgi:hypothetical protein